MSEEKKVDELVGSICEKLRKLFLYCTFINPDFIKGQISKHLEIPIEKVKLTCESSPTDDEGKETYRQYRLCIYGTEFVLLFDRKVDEPKEIDVPKIVKAPKKWWKKSADTTIIVEKKQTSKTPIEYWVLNMIEC